MILCTGCKTRWNGEWWNLFHGSGLAAGFAEAFAFVVSFAAGGGVAIDVARGFECGNGLEESGFGGWGVGAVVHVGVLAEEEGVEAFEAQALFICRGGEWVSHEGAAGGEAFFECFALQGGGHAHAGQEEVLLGGKVAAFGGFGAVCGAGSGFGGLQGFGAEFVQGEGGIGAGAVCEYEAGEFVYPGFDGVGGVDGFCHDVCFIGEDNVAAFALWFCFAERGEHSDECGGVGSLAEVDGVFLSPGGGEATEQHKQGDEGFHGGGGWKGLFCAADGDALEARVGFLGAGDNAGDGGQVVVDEAALVGIEFFHEKGFAGFEYAFCAGAGAPQEFGFGAGAVVVAIDPYARCICPPGLHQAVYHVLQVIEAVSFFADEEAGVCAFDEQGDAVLVWFGVEGKIEAERGEQGGGCIGGQGGELVGHGRGRLKYEVRVKGVIRRGRGGGAGR